MLAPALNPYLLLVPENPLPCFRLTVFTPVTFIAD